MATAMGRAYDEPVKGSPASIDDRTERFFDTVT
jgi:hypothetical protein